MGRNVPAENLQERVSTSLTPAAPPRHIISHPAHCSITFPLQRVDRFDDDTHRHKVCSPYQLPFLACCFFLPQRVDRFDDDIANIVTNSAKRSGLTFAPEAGTQVGVVGPTCLLLWCWVSSTVYLPLVLCGLCNFARW